MMMFIMDDDGDGYDVYDDDGYAVDGDYYGWWKWRLCGWIWCWLLLLLFYVYD